MLQVDYREITPGHYVMEQIDDGHQLETYVDERTVDYTDPHVVATELVDSGNYVCYSLMKSNFTPEEILEFAQIDAEVIVARRQALLEARAEQQDKLMTAIAAIALAKEEAAQVHTIFVVSTTKLQPQLTAVG
ncbi:hypothetical protein BH09PAT3_BH09PAT3_2650 [soil metagenome]